MMYRQTPSAGNHFPAACMPATLSNTGYAAGGCARAGGHA